MSLAQAARATVRPMEDSAMRLYYRERNGDYLAVDHETAEHYRRIGQPTMREGRATAIAGRIGSVCTTSMSVGFLRSQCTRVAKCRVPQSWLNAIG